MLRQQLGHGDASNYQQRVVEPMTSAPTLLGPYWYVAAVGLLLAALSYLLIARLVIDLLFPSPTGNLPFRIVRQVSDPVVRVVGAITPLIVPGPLVTACAIAWVFALRISVVQVLAAMAMGRVFG
jgi:hypothetical protein